MRSWFLFIVFIILIGFLGAAFGLYIGSVYVGLFIAVLVSIIYSLISYYSGDSMILKMSGARPVTKQEFPHLFHVVEGLAVSAGIPAPKAYVIEDSAMNAFATGRDPEPAVVPAHTHL